MYLNMPDTNEITFGTVMLHREKKMHLYLPLVVVLSVSIRGDI